jgi:heptosyltransferase-1
VKVLVVRLSAIGDVVHTLPALAALHHAGHEVSWLVEPPARSLLENQPMLAQVIAAPRAKQLRWGRAREAARALRERRFDVALDLQGLWKSAAWARIAGARRVIGAEGSARRERASALLMHETASVPAQAVHVIDRNLAVLGALGIDALGTREFPLPPLTPAATAVRRQLEALPLRDFAVLNPGGGWTSKLWPAEAYGALARRLAERGVPSIVSWGPGEQSLAETVVAASHGAARLAFPTTLLEFVELARFARVTVAADTGPLHLACAVGAPVVGLFGPTDPARNGPFAADDVVVRRAPACAPCHRRGCLVHADIMRAIDVDEVFHAVEERLRRTAAGARASS